MIGKVRESIQDSTSDEKERHLSISEAKRKRKEIQRWRNVHARKHGAAHTQYFGISSSPLLPTHKHKHKHTTQLTLSLTQPWLIPNPTPPLTLPPQVYLYPNRTLTSISIPHLFHSFFFL
ncbi:hypothetical protein PIB30_013440 [Stylosanthes scabra]|uniref:Uncharacterized protein n=1 Tax=Stylosanthes scabra TaxID=79078 RepID=A0ABU6Y504_9FABA|nr:hypothetical protein [Stylosanthes scabra]